MPNPLFAQDFLHPPDRHAFVMQQPLDAGQQRHIGGAIVAPPARTFDRPDLRKPAFPESQHMRGRLERFGNFTDGAKGLGRLVHAGKT